MPPTLTRGSTRTRAGTGRNTLRGLWQPGPESTLRAYVIVEGSNGQHGDGDAVASEGAALGRNFRSVINLLGATLGTLTVFHLSPPPGGGSFKSPDETYDAKTRWWIWVKTFRAVI